MSCELDSETSNFSKMPLTAISHRTQCILTQLLNNKKILRSDEGYQRDWRGLAALALPNCSLSESSIIDDNPAATVLKLWLKNNPITATFDYLEKYLALIDRWDVLDDAYDHLVRDAAKYQTEEEQRIRNEEELNSSVNVTDALNPLDINPADASILTKDDVLQAQKGQPPQQYDAFILFADADHEYAKELINKLENNTDYKFKLCTKDRDLLAGVSFEHVAVTQLIEERCKHLIIILTRQFLWSPENTFLVNYTQAYQIRHTIRKIIPLLYEEDLEIPRTLKIYTHLRYNPHSNGLFNFWSKLTTSILNVQPRRNLPLYNLPSGRIKSASTATTTAIATAPLAAAALTTGTDRLQPHDLQSNFVQSTNSTNLIDFQSRQEEELKNELTSQIKDLQLIESEIENADEIPSSRDMKYNISNAISELSDPPSLPGTVSDFYSISHKNDKDQIKKKKRWPMKKLLKNVFNRKQRTLSPVV